MCRYLLTNARQLHVFLFTIKLQTNKVLSDSPAIGVTIGQTRYNNYAAQQLTYGVMITAHVPLFYMERMVFDGVE